MWQVVSWLDARLPEARRLVTGGLYGLVRHPIYLGEIVGGAGLTLQAFSWPAFVIYLLFVAIQGARDSRTPVATAALWPERMECRISRISGMPCALAESTALAVPSVLPSSTKIVSKA